MPMTGAPRARTRSTVRLVSVVVPDWLMATTSVSAMSGRSRKPDSSVAGSASTRSGVGEHAARSASGQRLAGHRRRALADDEHPADVAAAQPGPDRLGEGLSPRRTTSSCPSRSTSWPAASCGTDAGASLISLSRKWGKSPRSMSRVVISAPRSARPRSTGSARAVVGQPPMPSSVPGLAPVEHHDLAAAAWGCRGRPASRRPCAGSGR